MLKKLKLVVLSLLVMFMTVQKSHAVVGLLSGTGSLAVSGLVTAGASFTLGQGMKFLGAREAGGVVSAVGTFIGFIILDEQGENLSFKQLTLDDGKKLGFSKEEVEIYNGELEDVNLIFSEVQHHLDKHSTVEDARHLWSDYADYISPETFELMQAIASQK